MRVLPAGSMNLPHRDYWLAPERRPQTVDWISGQVAWLGCINVLFLAGIYWLTLQANHLNPVHLPLNLFLAFVAVFLMAMTLWVFRFYRHFAKR